MHDVITAAEHVVDYVVDHVVDLWTCPLALVYHLSVLVQCKLCHLLSQNCLSESVGFTCNRWGLGRRLHECACVLYKPHLL